MAVRRRSLVKRCDYVSNEDSTWDGYSSSDEFEFISKRNSKGRSVKSIRSLLKESHSYEKTDEHTYTQIPNCRGKRVRKDSACEYNQRGNKKARCENRNAINARMNRERKKAHVASLENEVQQLKLENREYSNKLHDQEATIIEMKQEMTHLKSLIANSKNLCALVNKLSQVTGLPVTSSFISKIGQDNGCGTLNPRTRSVHSGLNHPIARKDVNLGGGDMDNFYLPSVIGDDTETLFPPLESDEMLEFDTNEFLPLDYAEPMGADLPAEKSVGICVHISQSKLSVEFCYLCNARAMSA